MDTDQTTQHQARPPHVGRVATLDLSRLAGATVLSVWAHPDDETYLSGGLMAEVRATGGRVVNVTATLGEHGTPDPGTFLPTAWPPYARRELFAALAELGVYEVEILGYEDGTLDRVDPRTGTEQILSVLEEVQPDVVVSFGPDGMTGHPDHVAVGRWTETAVAAWRGDPALLQATAAGAMPDELTAMLLELGAFFGDPPSTQPGEHDLVLNLDEATLGAKLAALAADRSQTEIVRAAVGESNYLRMVEIEVFRAANQRARDLLTTDRFDTAA